jgi:GT2 family glycosyltransferase
LAQSYSPDEVLVIDDGSVDSTVELASRFPGVRIVKHGRNGGLAKARNTGHREASNELVASLDADCVADERWLETLVAEMADSDVAAVGGKLIETVLDSVADRWRKAHMSQDWGDARVENPQFMFGNNSLMRKPAVERAGWYDESMRTNGEDAYMSERFAAMGMRTIYQPSATVRHLRQDSVGSILDAFWRYWKFGSKAGQKKIKWKTFRKTVWRVHLVGWINKTLLADLRRRNFDLLWIDLVLPAYMLGRYTTLFLRSRRRANSVT